MLDLELKARCDDLGGLRARCESLGAEGQEPERQIDTYFTVAAGRLTLRETLESGAALIHYLRDDVAGPQACHYDLYPVEDPEGLKAMLANALGVSVVVAKRRQTFVLGASESTSTRCRDWGLCRVARDGRGAERAPPWWQTRSRVCGRRWGSTHRRWSKSRMPP
ncbi:MAG: hypothetical protein M5R38_18930 [Candidatus Methylomirabilis sp.]|nr:hypothetical protein [Candidatus Methylomirabilis sp.]